MKNLFKPLLFNFDMSGKQVTSLRAGRATHAAHVTSKLSWVDTPVKVKVESEIVKVKV